MAVLVFTAIFTESAEARAHTLQSLRLVTVWPMFSAAMLSLITGVILGLGSKYGLVRYWWVAIKLGLNIILSTLVVSPLYEARSLRQPILAVSSPPVSILTGTSATCFIRRSCHRRR
jgi:hypothetical protein